MVMSGIRTRHEEPIHGMICAAAEASPSQLVVTWIFMKHAWEDRCRHICANAVVRKGGAETVRIGSPTLSTVFWIVSCLRNRREGPAKGVRSPIKNAGGGQSELLSRRDRRKVFGVFNRPIIRHDLEDAIVNGSCFFLQFALPNGLARLVGFLLVLPVLGT